MRISDWSSDVCSSDLVENIFSERGSADADAASDDSKLVRALWFGMSDGDAALEALRAAGFAQEPQQVAAAIDELRNARLVRAMPDSGVQKMIALLATLLDAARDQPHPEVALCRVLSVVQAKIGRAHV